MRWPASSAQSGRDVETPEMYDEEVSRSVAGETLALREQRWPAGRLHCRIGESLRRPARTDSRYRIGRKGGVRMNVMGCRVALAFIEAQHYQARLLHLLPREDAPCDHRDARWSTSYCRPRCCWYERARLYLVENRHRRGGRPARGPNVHGRAGRPRGDVVNGVRRGRPGCRDPHGRPGRRRTARGSRTWRARER
jgi:hypothetical protein